MYTEGDRRGMLSLQHQRKPLNPSQQTRLVPTYSKIQTQWENKPTEHNYRVCRLIGNHCGIQYYVKPCWQAVLSHFHLVPFFAVASLWGELKQECKDGLCTIDWTWKQSTIGTLQTRTRKVIDWQRHCSVYNYI